MHAIVLTLLLFSFSQNGMAQAQLGQSRLVSAPHVQAGVGDVVQLRLGEWANVSGEGTDFVQVVFREYLTDESRAVFQVHASVGGSSQQYTLTVGAQDSGFIVEVLKADSLRALITIPKSFNIQ